MNFHFRTEAILFESVGFTPLELQYLDARLIRWMEDRKTGGADMSDQAFLAVALTMASACVNALIQLQGRPPDVHGFGEDYQRVLSIRQIARANYYYLLWDNLNTDPTDVGSESWWKFQKEHRLAILVAVHDEFDDDTAARPDKETEGDKQTVTAADVASVESVIEPGAA